MDDFERTARTDEGQEILRKVDLLEQGCEPIGNINFPTFITLARGGYLEASTYGVALTGDGREAIGL